MEFRDQLAQAIRTADGNNSLGAAALSDAIAAALPGMVKPLEWSKWDGGMTTARTPFGKYILDQDWRMSRWGSGQIFRYENEQSAKTASETHYRAAVMSAFGQ